MEEKYSKKYRHESDPMEKKLHDSLKRFVIDGKIHKELCIRYNIDCYFERCNNNSPMDKEAMYRFHTIGWIQPPKLVEKKHSKLKLSKDWKIPYGLDAHTMESLIKAGYWLKDSDHIFFEMTKDFLSLNPELKNSGIIPNYDALMGFTSAMNLDDILAYQSQGGGCLRSPSFQIRCRVADQGLGMQTQWVFSEKTLLKIEKYLENQ